MIYKVLTADEARRLSAQKREETDRKNDAAHHKALLDAINRGERFVHLVLPNSTGLSDKLIKTGKKIGKPFQSDYGGEQSATVSW